MLDGVDGCDTKPGGQQCGVKSVASDVRLTLCALAKNGSSLEVICAEGH